MDSESQAKTHDIKRPLTSPNTHNHRDKARQAAVEDYLDQDKQGPGSVAHPHQPNYASSPEVPFYTIHQAGPNDNRSPVTQFSQHSNQAASNSNQAASNSNPNETSSRDAGPHDPIQTYEYAATPTREVDCQPSSPNAYHHKGSSNDFSSPSTFISTPNTIPRESFLSPGKNGSTWSPGSYYRTPGYPPPSQLPTCPVPPQFATAHGYPPEAPHIVPYSHVNFNPDGFEINQRGTFFPSQNIIHPPPPSATLPNMDPRDNGPRVPLEQHIGYALLSARLAGDVRPEATPSYRRFRRLNHRLLLTYQLKLVHLESRLYDQDSGEVSRNDRPRNGWSDAEERMRADDGDPMLRRRYEILQDIEETLLKYSK